MTLDTSTGQLFRMPIFFGPSVGPRQGPDGSALETTNTECLAVSVSFDTDGDDLERLLPPRFVLIEPVVTISAKYLSSVAWLAGRGYNILEVGIPVRYHGRDETIEGDLTLVQWENMADPIMTGREELGFAKIYCELPPVRRIERAVICEASWDGFTFARLRFMADEDEPVGEQASRARLHFKYVPRTGTWGEADAEYVTMTPAAERSMIVNEKTAGRGAVEFFPANWEQMPTQHKIVNALGGLERRRFFDAAVVQGVVTSTLRGQRIVE